jgi:hypothetical protein
VTGYIRYNETIDAFECFGTDNVWSTVALKTWLRTSATSPDIFFSSGKVGIGLSNFSDSGNAGFVVAKDTHLGTGLTEVAGGPFFKQKRWSGNLQITHIITFDAYCGNGALNTTVCAGTLHLQIRNTDYRMNSITMSFIKDSSVGLQLFESVYHISAAKTSILPSVVTTVTGSSIVVSTSTENTPIDISWTSIGSSIVVTI